MTSLQQGYLQCIPPGSDQAQKVFVNVTPQEIVIYPEDPAKFGQGIAPISRFNIQKIQLVDSGDFQRPKSFGVVTDRGSLIEFSCPTNSVRSSWIKSISEYAPDNSNGAPPSQRIPAAAPPGNGSDVYRTPVINTYRIPAASNGGTTTHNNVNRFSDFDGFANQALNQLNSLKGNAPASSFAAPSSAIAVPRPTAAAIANPVRGSSAARLVQPTASRGAPAPLVNVPQASTAAVVSAAPVLVAPQPMIRRPNPTTAKPAQPPAQQSSKPLPKWMPGHYKATTLVGNAKNTSPQRARNQYAQNQPQQASTLLGRSLSAPGYDNGTSIAKQQHQGFYQSEPGGFPAHPSQFQQYQTQPQYQTQSQYHDHSNSHPSAHPPAQQGLPLEKMTLEQLRSAFMQMPSELRSAIVGPNDHGGEPTVQGRPSSQPGSRKPSTHRDRAYGSEEEENDDYERKRGRGRGRSDHHSDHYEQEDDDDRYRSRNRNRSRSRQNTRDRSISESEESRERRSSHRRSSKSKHHVESNEDDDYDHDQYNRQGRGGDRAHYSNRNRDAYDEHQVEEEEQRFDLPDREDKRRHSVPSRLDYTDHSDPEHEPLQPQDLEYSHFSRRREEVEDKVPRYMQSKSKGRQDAPERARASTPNAPPNRSSSNPKGSKGKPPLERARSAPPASTNARDFAQKTKSPVPRGDLLEWSKKQAWQKHVSSGFPISKAQEKAINKAVTHPNGKSNEKPSESSKLTHVNQLGSSTQRMRAMEENLRRSSIANSAGSNKPTPATPGSFFDFMRTRGAPVPAGIQNAQVKGNEHQRRQSIEQQEDKMKTKLTKLNFPSPEQISSGLNRTDKFFPSSSGSPPQKNVQQQLQHLKTKQVSKKPPSPPERQSKRANDYISFDHFQKNQQATTRQTKLLQHRHSLDDASTISNSTQSIVRIERTNSQQQMLQSNSTTPLTDVAEWQRVTNWLTSIRMERYIPTFREHGITKLSLIELLPEDAFWELGIESDDIPVIKRKVAEFSARIKSFSEEGALFTSITATQGFRNGRHDGILEDGEEEDEDVGLVLGASDPSPVNPNPLHKATKHFSPISDIQAFQIDLLQLFDFGQYSPFMSLWERFLHFYLPASALTNEAALSASSVHQRPALFYAKQAMEFHLFVYFYVFSIRKSLSKEEITVVRAALKEYLEGLAQQYESFHPLLEEKVFALAQPPHTNSTITTATDNNYPTSSSAAVVVDESLALPASTMAPSLNESHVDASSSSPPKPLITSREFAAFAGLVFVPNPQYNPAFQTLFTDEWALALRQRLTQFVAILIEEHEKELLKQPVVLVEEAPAQQPPPKPVKEPLSLAKPAEIEVEGKRKAVEKLVLQTAEISPIHGSEPILRDDLKEGFNLADRIVSGNEQHYQHQRVHNFVSQTASMQQQSEQYHSFDRPAESPQSNSSTISQLTDDTPLKNDPHHSTGHRIASKPEVPNTQSAAFTFNKSSALAEAANRANVKLRNLQSHPVGPTNGHQTSSPVVLGASVSNNNGSGSKPRISPSPPKTSLQMQVDNYNKLLKQNRLPKATAAVNANPPMPSLASTSMEIQQQTNSLLEEMQLPANKDLLNQIDAIIAPINNPVSSTIPTPAPAVSKANPVGGSRGFNLGVTIPRPSSSSNNVIPPNAPILPPVDSSALADQVNRYKSLLKGKTTSSSEGANSRELEPATSVPTTSATKLEQEIPKSVEEIGKGDVVKPEETVEQRTGEETEPKNKEAIENVLDNTDLDEVDRSLPSPKFQGGKIILLKEESETNDRREIAIASKTEVAKTDSSRSEPTQEKAEATLTKESEKGLDQIILSSEPLKQVEEKEQKEQQIEHTKVEVQEITPSVATPTPVPETITEQHQRTPSPSISPPPSATIEEAPEQKEKADEVDNGEVEESFLAEEGDEVANGNQITNNQTSTTKSKKKKKKKSAK